MAYFNEEEIAEAFFVCDFCGKTIAFHGHELAEKSASRIILDHFNECPNAPKEDTA